MQGHPVAEGVVAGRVDRLDSDTQLADGRRHQDPRRRGGERLPVDEHRAGGHALTGQAELATQVAIGDPPAAATALGAAHGGRHAEDRQLGRRRWRHREAVRRLETNRVVADVAALGEQDRDGFRGVMGAAAAAAEALST